MPLVAVDENKNRLDTFSNLKEIDELRAKKNLFWCPHCEGEMVFTHGTLVIPHFRHKTNCPYATEPESEQHLNMKAFMKKLFPTAELEKKIANRINDVCFGDIAIECQVSPISETEIYERTRDYNNSGKSVFWLLGNRSAEEVENGIENRVKCYERCINRLYNTVYFYRAAYSIESDDDASPYEEDIVDCKKYRRNFSIQRRLSNSKFGGHPKFNFSKSNFYFEKDFRIYNDELEWWNNMGDSYMGNSYQASHPKPQLPIIAELQLARLVW